MIQNLDAKVSKSIYSLLSLYESTVDYQFPWHAAYVFSLYIVILFIKLIDKYKVLVNMSQKNTKFK